MNRPDLDFLSRAYVEGLKESPELYLGIELEFPIVNLRGQATDISVSKALLNHLAERLGFEVLERDEEGNPIQLMDRLSQDQLLFEVSYNILEMAFGKAKTIGQVERRFQTYLKVIQAFLAPYHHGLAGLGVHPTWALNDNRPVATPRYQMLSQYLALAKAYPSMDFHDYSDYGGFICGSQVQLDVSKHDYLKVLNIFNQLEGVKAYLFANSPFSDGNCQLCLSRDYFWEKSMHGYFQENVGLYPQTFDSESDFLNYLSQSSLFYLWRAGKIYYFPPIRVKDYLKEPIIQAYDLTGQVHYFQPLPEDLTHHRSYHYQLLTKRGTVEFRSVCCQPWDKTFAPAAFHLGLLVNLANCEALLDSPRFDSLLGQHVMALRQRLSMTKADSKEVALLRELAQALLDCAKQGLEQRGYGEETYLDGVLKDK